MANITLSYRSGPFLVFSLVILATITLIVTNVFYAQRSKTSASISCADKLTSEEELTSTNSDSEETFFSSSNTPKTTAICLIGVPQSWANTSKYFLKNVLIPLNANLFIVTPSFVANDPLIEYLFPYATEIRSSHNATQVLSEFDKQSPNWRNLITDFNESVKKYGTKKKNKNTLAFLGGLPGNPATLRIKHAAEQITDVSLCEKLVKENEIRRGVNYDWVGFGRLDLMWTENHPDPADLVKKTITPEFDPQTSKLCFIPCEGNDWGGYCDHWAFCTRKAAKDFSMGPFDVVQNYKSWGKWQGNRNRESMVKYNLVSHDVKVERFHADFFRTCAVAGVGKKGNHDCKFLPRAGEVVE